MKNLYKVFNITEEIDKVESETKAINWKTYCTNNRNH